MMRPIVCLAFLLALLPAPTRAQQRPGGQEEALKQLVEEQARRLELLERRLATLEDTLRALGGLPSPQATGSPSQVTNERADPKAMVADPPDEHAIDGQPPDDPNPAAPAGDLPRALFIDSYGSLRAAFVVDEDGFAELRNNSSRLGLRGEKRFASGVNAFARYEVGMNLVANDRAIISGDPGAPIGQGAFPLFTRLGFVGIQSRFGMLSFGKQWAAYYDVAEFTDQFQIFGGAAHGGFGAGTDGGLAGTGRAEKALLYRETIGWFSGAVQTQIRATSPNDRHVFDTWGASVILGKATGFAAGAAFNQVRDGVAAPNPNQAHLGDEAAIFGARFRSANWYSAATYSVLTDHEIDDLGRRFSGDGIELALRRAFGPRYWIELGFNNLRPDSDHDGDFRTRFWLANLIYQFGDASRVFIGGRIDDSRNSDNTRRALGAFTAGLNYTF